MKMVYKKIVFLLSVGIALGFPSLLFAAGAAKSLPPEVRAFCGQLDKKNSDSFTILAGRITKLEAVQLSQSDNIKKERQARDTKLSYDRAQVDLDQARSMDKLGAQAKTDEQKEAFGVFKNTTRAAIAERRSAIDTATQTLRKQLDDALNTRESKLKTATTAFKSSVQLSFAKAQSDCGNNARAKNAEATLQKNLKTAREKFDAASKDTQNKDLQSLAKTQQEAINKANEDFAAAVKTAQANFKATFGKH